MEGILPVDPALNGMLCLTQSPRTLECWCRNLTCRTENSPTLRAAYGRLRRSLATKQRGTWDLDYACYLRILVDEGWKVCHSPNQDCWSSLPESLQTVVKRLGDAIPVHSVIIGFHPSLPLLSPPSPTGGSPVELPFRTFTPFNTASTSRQNESSSKILWSSAKSG